MIIDNGDTLIRGSGDVLILDSVDILIRGSVDTLIMLLPQQKLHVGGNGINVEPAAAAIKMRTAVKPLAQNYSFLHPKMATHPTDITESFLIKLYARHTEDGIPLNARSCWPKRVIPRPTCTSQTLIFQTILGSVVPRCN